LGTVFQTTHNRCLAAVLFLIGVGS
jgi:hypothetical protein